MSLLTAQCGGATAGSIATAAIVVVVALSLYGLVVRRLFLAPRDARPLLVGTFAAGLTLGAVVAFLLPESVPAGLRTIGGLLLAGVLGGLVATSVRVGSPRGYVIAAQLGAVTPAALFVAALAVVLGLTDACLD